MVELRGLFTRTILFSAGLTRLAATRSTTRTFLYGCGFASGFRGRRRRGLFSHDPFGRHVKVRTIPSGNLVVTVALIAALFKFVVATEARLQLFLPRTIVSNHAEIMVCELKIIFGVHAVTGKLCVTRQIAIFLQQLRSIATRAIVNPVTVVAPAIAAVRTSIIPAAIAATGLTIVHQ
jgi:hypothetical protein